MRRFLESSPFSLPLVALILAAPVYAQNPLRGNPVDAMPRLERPPAATPAPPVVEAPTPEQIAVQSRLAQRIIPKNFDVSGVHVLPFDEISAVLAPLSGKEISVAELVLHVDKITQLYRDRGFPLSFALLQNQNFANGLVVVTVVEGYVGSVRIEGDLGGAKGRLETLAGPLKDEKPLTQATLERVLNLMRTVPGVAFTPSLELPKRADGATELVLEATHKPVGLSGGLADLGTGMQPMLNVVTNSLTPLGEQVKLSAALPTYSNAVNYISGEVRVPIGANGMAVKIDGYHYKADPEDSTAAALGYDRHIRTDRIGIGLSYPFLLNNRRSLTGSMGVYAVNSLALYPARNSSQWLQQDAEVRAFTADMRYFQASETATSDITLAVSKGIDGLGAKKSITSIFGYSDVPAIDLDFTRVNLNARQTFVLPGQFGLTLAGAGQYSGNTLPTSEQVSFGGWRFAMGYPQGEQSGDKGLGMSLELNRRFNIGWKYFSSVQPYALVDYARTWFNNSAQQALNNRHLSSVAVGARFTDDRYYLLDFNLAKPVGAASVGSNERNLRFNANYSFFYDAF